MGDEGIETGERDPSRCAGGETDMSWCITRPDLSVEDDTVRSFIAGAMGAMCRRSSTCALGLVFAEVVVFEEEGRAGAGWGCGGVAPEGVVVTGAAITTQSASALKITGEGNLL